MTALWRRVREAVAEHGLAAVVQVVAVRGSAPREAGAAMVVRPDGGFRGTIGGGTLEWEAIAQARRQLAEGRGPALRRQWPLGPDLGQCCGGSVVTVTETFDAGDAALLEQWAAWREAGHGLVAVLGPDGRVRREPGGAPAPAEGWSEAAAPPAHPVGLFGAGHVGRAVALALAPLPVALHWIDPRADAFPPLVPANAQALRASDPAAAVAALPAGAALLVMTHSHPLDLAVVAAALGRGDLGPVGLIGSASKRARFLARLGEAGLGEAAARRLVCPIGIPGITGKEPAVIAASVAAQVLLWIEAARALAGTADAASTGPGPRRPAGRRANPPAEVRIGRGRRAGGRP